VVCAVGTLLVEGGLMVLRMARADARARSEKEAKKAAKTELAAVPVDPLRGCEGGAVAGESVGKEKAE